MSTVWECDGCGLQGTEEEVDKHVLEEADKVDWDVAKIRCWGCMAVGSPAWLEFHVNGVHPMAQIVQVVTEAFRRLN